MVYIFLADGFEEIEALTQIDFLRRAGIEIKSVGVGKEYITGSHGITVKSDILSDDLDVNNAEMIILPGGMPGVTNLFECDKVTDAVRVAEKNGAYIAAICAAPMILGRLGFSQGREMICYPGFESELKGAVISEKNVVTDGKFITAKAVGSAAEFSFEIIKALKGDASAESVMDSIYYDK